MIEPGGVGADRPDINVPGFELHRVIGRGGFAVVYEAYQPSLDRLVALKVLSRLDGRALELFERECRAVGRLGWHDHIVDVFQTGAVPDGRPYLVMEHLEQGSLADRLGSSPPAAPWGPLGWAEVLGIGAQLASALAAAHDAGTLHRDVKPANVLQDGDRVKLSDFGIATLRAPVGDGDRSDTGYQFVSAGFASPEAFERSDVVDHRADLYSLGATLYTLLAGRLMTGRTVDLRELHVPADLVEVIEALTEHRPGDRPQSALAAGNALGQCQARAGLPVDRIVVRRPGAGPRDHEPAVDHDAAGPTDPSSLVVEGPRHGPSPLAVPAARPGQPPPPSEPTLPVARGRDAPAPTGRRRPRATSSRRPVRRTARLAVGVILLVAVAATALAIVLGLMRPGGSPTGPAYPVILEPTGGVVAADEPLTVRFDLPSHTESWDVFVDSKPAVGDEARGRSATITLSAGHHDLIVRATLSDGLSVESDRVELTAT